MPQLGGSAAEDVRSPRRVEPDEAELVRRAQLGSSAAFDSLVHARGPDLYRYLIVRLRNESDARDALQETMTAAWQGLPGLRQPDRFWPWLVAIAGRKAAAIARRRIRGSEQGLDLLTHDDENLIEIRDAIARLPAHLRTSRGRDGTGVPSISAGGHPLPLAVARRLAALPPLERDHTLRVGELEAESASRRDGRVL